MFYSLQLLCHAMPLVFQKCRVATARRCHWLLGDVTDTGDVWLIHPTVCRRGNLLHLVDFGLFGCLKKRRGLGLAHEDPNLGPAIFYNMEKR